MATAVIYPERRRWGWWARMRAQLARFRTWLDIKLSRAGTWLRGPGLTRTKALGRFVKRQWFRGWNFTKRVAMKVPPGVRRVIAWPLRIVSSAGIWTIGAVVLVAVAIFGVLAWTTSKYHDHVHQRLVHASQYHPTRSVKVTDGQRVEVKDDEVIVYDEHATPKVDRAKMDLRDHVKVKVRGQEMEIAPLYIRDNDEVDTNWPVILGVKDEQELLDRVLNKDPRIGVAIEEQDPETQLNITERIFTLLQAVDPGPKDEKNNKELTSEWFGRLIALQTFTQSYQTETGQPDVKVGDLHIFMKEKGFFGVDPSSIVAKDQKVWIKHRETGDAEKKREFAFFIAPTYRTGFLEQWDRLKDNYGAASA